MAIKAVVMDVDGVLTDGTVWLDESRTRDRSGSRSRTSWASRSAGGPACSSPWCPGRAWPGLDAIAAKFGIADVYARLQGQGGGASATSRLVTISQLAEVCFIGDDVNDVPALEICGLAVAPAGAQAVASAAATMVTSRRGGDGAVREVIDHPARGEPYAHARPLRHVAQRRDPR